MHRVQLRAPGPWGSGDTAPYALAREVEDLPALVSEAGGSAHLPGVSSGGALALEAVAAGLPVSTLSVYEVPYDMTGGAPRHQHAFAERLRALVESGDSEGALVHAMRNWGSPEDQIEAARHTPMWPGLLELAPTLVYDVTCLGTGAPATERLATISRPVLVLDGELGAGFFGPAADAIAGSVPHSRHRTFAGQGHVADPEAIAEVLLAFHPG
ncbi:alpha/beta fold hydrolase [Sciscionella marina]|uniref:alpha/beta fold hydrolase n=1 Tax=Sciscionella marina TaxID=508770 RepID=UPI00039D603F|nr:alpha/beta hydrolase [Sciscionella marina]